MSDIDTCPYRTVAKRLDCCCVPSCPSVTTNEQTNPTCSYCGAQMIVRCPCGKCDLITIVQACPTCDPARVKKLGKMNGTKVCAEYVAQQVRGEER